MNSIRFLVIVLGDGYLTENELRNDPWHLESSGCLEKLHNHKRASLPGQLPGNFDVYDTNKDGLIGRLEFKAVVEKQHREISTELFDNVMEKISRCELITPISEHCI